MRYVVGYARGNVDGLNFAASLARTQGASIDLVSVVDAPLESMSSQRARRIEQSLEQAAAHVSEVSVDTHVVAGTSVAEGLSRHASERDAKLIAVGTRRQDLLSKLTAGPITHALLRNSPVPVALACEEFADVDTFSRMSVGIGQRAGSENLLDVALEAASEQGLPVRFISLAGLDAAEYDAGAYAEARRHILMVQDWARNQLPAGSEMSIEVAKGGDIARAFKALSWERDEFLVLGASRIAQGHKFFLGSQASKILRSVPVSVIVVPQDYQADL